MRITRPILYLGVFPAALVFVLAVTLTDGAMNVPSSFRKPADPALADAVARPLDATWTAVEIPASDGARLRAWLFRPHESNGDAAIVLHGHMDTRRGVLSHASLLLRHGYTVLAPDSRGHGTSGGDVVTFGIVESDDIHRWSRWLKPNAGARHVYGLGESMGAAVILQSTRDDTSFSAVVAEGSFSSFRKIALDRLSQRLGLSRTASYAFLWPIVDTGILYSRARFGIDLIAASPVDALRHARTPVLLIHGDADTNIPPDHTDDLAAADPQAQTWKPGSTGHVAAISTHPAEFETRVIEWFSTHR